MKIRHWNKLSSDEKNFVMRRSETDISNQMSLAAQIAQDIRENGDAAVARYTAEFDHAHVTNVKVSEQEIHDAYGRIDAKLRDAITYAAENIKTFHKEQMPPEYFLKEVRPGIMAGEKVTPIQNVCLYVPRGKGSFPSVLLMLGVPAIVAGVPEIVVVTPPDQNGNADDALLGAAKIIGIKNIYKVGGIQAVAAVAHGTQCIPKCLKIIGPGNSYVTAAKRALSQYIDAGLPAGPSESIIMCDEHTNPRIAALDLMIEAEHGSDSAALLVTHHEPLVDAVIPIIKEQLKKVSLKRAEFITDNLNQYGGVILTHSLEQSIEFTNEYAPEHMEILTKDPLAILPMIKNAGEVLLGENTPITLGNYLLGLNAILPTGGYAKTHSGVSVHDFLKRSSVGYVTAKGLEDAKDHAAIFATAEGFDSHALAVSDRQPSK